MNLPEKIKLLRVTLDSSHCGQLTHGSRYRFAYASEIPSQASVGILMPAERSLTWEETALFPVMDMNLPEGYLFNQLREAFPKQALTPMHLLALIGNNGIGRLGYVHETTPPAPAGQVLDRQTLIRSTNSGLFTELVHAYLSTGIGISGLQPKILVPDRATFTIPNLIVKASSPTYPGLAANEYLCLKAAATAEIEVSAFELSDDGERLILDRFDVTQDGRRIGFEDIASLTGKLVRDTLSDRKYHGSYEGVADVLKRLRLSVASITAFFEQVAFSVMVGNGDAHLKNFGVLYTSASDLRLAPMFDVVTTRIYQFSRYGGGPPVEDNTMALKLFRGSKSKTYPLAAELLDFGRRVCNVSRPQDVLTSIADAMSVTLKNAHSDSRIPKGLLDSMSSRWELGLQLAKDAVKDSPASHRRRRESP